MNKPTDPRKHGLKEPQKILVEYKFIDCKTNNLFKVIETWNSFQKELLDNNWKIEDTEIISGWPWTIRVKVTKNNDYFDHQLLVYKQKVEQFEKDLEEWKKETEKKQSEIDNESIHDTIARLEKRLDRLKAIRDNELKISYNI